MALSNEPHEFRPELLSMREREVLELAVAGRTDEVIAQTLGLTTSTVNSYWVRIRGKLGQFSRTEIVGLVLRNQAHLQQADLVAENDQLRESGQQSRDDLAQARQDLASARGVAWHGMALDHMPHATVVCRPPGHVIYANLQAQASFAASPGKINDIALWELTIPEERTARQLIISGFFTSEGPPRVVMGVERPLYALRFDGTNFRSILVVERFDGPEGRMSVATFRDTAEDVEALLRTLRKPFVVS